jgi:hypothetical protein
VIDPQSTLLLPVVDLPAYGVAHAVDAAVAGKANSKKDPPTCVQLIFTHWLATGCAVMVGQAAMLTV